MSCALCPSCKAHSGLIFLTRSLRSLIPYLSDQSVKNVLTVDSTVNLVQVPLTEIMQEMSAFLYDAPLYSNTSSGVSKAFVIFMIAWSIKVLFSPLMDTVISLPSAASVQRRGRNYHKTTVGSHGAGLVESFLTRLHISFYTL